MKRPIKSLLVIAALATAGACRAFAADAAPPPREIEIQTDQGPVKGKIISPPSSIEKPEDIGKRVHTPLRVFVPDHPIEPPRNPNADRLK